MTSKKEPIYKTIFNSLVLELNSTKFKKNDPFYSENDIRTKYQVSSTTAVRVLNTLASEGYIHRVQGRGSFVSKFNRGTSVKITDTHIYDQNNEQVAVLVANNEVNPPSQANFKDKETWYFERLRQVNNASFEYSTSWYAKNLIDSNDIKHPSKIHSLYSLINKETGLDMLQQEFSQNYSIVPVSNQRIADYLHVKLNTMVVKIERWVYKEDVNLEYTVSYLLTNYFGLHIISDNKFININTIK